MRKLKWYFDFISPFAYFQLKQIPDLPDDLQVEYVPVLFAGLLKYWGNVGPAEFEPKRQHTYRYCQWYADRHDIPFTMAEAHPFNPISILRLAIQQGSNAGDIEAIFDTVWCQGLAPNSSEFWKVLSTRIGRECNSDEVFADDVKLQLRMNTEQAIAETVFGVPTFQVGGEIFWGTDSFSTLLDYLANPEIFQDPKYIQIANTPSVAQRNISTK
ncbi:MAG: 2-hydroxychromene-2-carboxylate isomerase [Parasphingorhabdus sp.]|jgi:2-hydroxychromene-2-carboxylate isomerase